MRHKTLSNAIKIYVRLVHASPIVYKKEKWFNKKQKVKLLGIKWELFRQNHSIRIARPLCFHLISDGQRSGGCHRRRPPLPFRLLLLPTLSLFLLALHFFSLALWFFSLNPGSLSLQTPTFLHLRVTWWLQSGKILFNFNLVLGLCISSLDWKNNDNLKCTDCTKSRLYIGKEEYDAYICIPRVWLFSWNLVLHKYTRFWISQVWNSNFNFILWVCRSNIIF